MTVLYVAHPVSPSPAEMNAILIIHGQEPGLAPSPLRIRQAIAANVQRGLRWLAWLMKSFPRVTFIAPWITAIASGADDNIPEERERGLRDCNRMIELCNGIVLCGGRISSGMQRERHHGIALHVARSEEAFMRPTFGVYDLTDLGPSTPLTLGVLRATSAGDHPALMALAGLG